MPRPAGRRAAAGRASRRPRRGRGACASSAPRSSATGLRAVARRAGHADAAATSATVAASAIASGPSSALPGGSSLSVARRSPVGPAASRAPSASPTMAAGSATMAARSAYAATIVARGNPSARCTPIVDRRRCTSACAATPSITPAAAEHDGREGDEQRQHDPCRLVEQHPDAVVRDEAQVLDAEARGARLLQRDVDPVRDRGSTRGPCSSRDAGRSAPRRRPAPSSPAGRRRCRGSRRSRTRGRCRSARRTACRPRRGAMRGRRRARRRRRRPRARRGPRRSRTRACPGRRPGPRRGGSSRSRRERRTRVISVRYDVASTFGSARSFSSISPTRSRSKRAMTSGRSAAFAERSNPVASDQLTVTAVPSIVAASRTPAPASSERRPPARTSTRASRSAAFIQPARRPAGAAPAWRRRWPPPRG